MINNKIQSMDRKELLQHIEHIDDKIKYYITQFRQYFLKVQEGEEVTRTHYHYLRKARYAFKQAMRLDEKKEEAENRLSSLGFAINTKKSEENFEV